MNAIQWQAPPKKVKLEPNEIHVWRACLDRSWFPLQQMHNILSDREQSRADRFVFKRDRHRYIAGRGILRLLIGNFYLNKPPQQLTFGYGTKGKPFLIQSKSKDRIEFNQSESHGTALYAFTLSNEIGIDIEYMRPVADMQQIVDRNFSEYEKSSFNGLKTNAKLDGFFNCWTRKEAFIKAIGQGLYFPLDQFDVSLSPGIPAQLLRVSECQEDITKWTLIEFTPKTGFKAALATKQQNCTYRFYHFSKVVNL